MGRLCCGCNFCMYPSYLKCITSRLKGEFLSGWLLNSFFVTVVRFMQVLYAFPLSCAPLWMDPIECWFNFLLLVLEWPGVPLIFMFPLLGTFYFAGISSLSSLEKSKAKSSCTLHPFIYVLIVYLSVLPGQSPWSFPFYNSWGIASFPCYYTFSLFLSSALEQHGVSSWQMITE